MARNAKSSYDHHYAPTPPPYLHRERTRHGAIVWYVRIDKGPRIRIRGDYGSPEFKAAYDAAISGQTPPQKTRAPATHSLAWLIDRYRDSGAWARLSGATRRQRENIFLHVIETAGDELFAKITRKTIAAAMDRRKETPFAAIDFLKACADCSAGLLNLATSRAIQRKGYAALVLRPRASIAGRTRKSKL